MASSSSFLTDKLPTIAGVAGAVGARSLISAAYEKRRGEGGPPVNPADEGVSWRNAIAWTAVLASGAGIGRLVARYVAKDQIEKVLQRRVHAK